MALECPHCHSTDTDVVKNGFLGEGKQRYLCQNQECSHRSFIRAYTYNGCRKEVKRKIPQMAVNGSGIKEQLLKEASDASRVLGANALR